MDDKYYKIKIQIKIKIGGAMMTNLLLEILKSRSVSELKKINEDNVIVEAYSDIQCINIDGFEINKITKDELLGLSINRLVPFSHIFSFDSYGSLEEHIHDCARFSNGKYVFSKYGSIIGTMRDRHLISFTDSECIFVMEDDMSCIKVFDNALELAKVMIIISIMLLKNTDMQDFEDACLVHGIGFQNVNTFRKIKEIDEI